MEVWDINTSIFICVQEEDRMNHVTSKSAYIVSQPHHEKFFFKKKGNKSQGNNGPDKRFGPSHMPFGLKPIS